MTLPVKTRDHSRCDCPRSVHGVAPPLRARRTAIDIDVPCANAETLRPTSMISLATSPRSSHAR
jgi:hypothetical protein